MAIAKFTIEMAADLGQLKKDISELNKTVGTIGGQLSTALKPYTRDLDGASKSYVALMNAAKEARRQIEFSIPAGDFSVLSNGQRDATLKSLLDQKVLRQEQYKNIQLAYQLQDFGVQVMGGQNPLVALVQQGSQLSGIYGGVGNAFKAVTALFTPMRVAVGGAAAGLGILAKAFLDGDEQSAKFRQSIALTGNYAGLTADTFERLVKTVSAVSDVGAGKAREMAQALVSSGRFTSQGLDQLTATGLNMAKATGQSAEQVAQQFTQMADAPTQWASQINKTYHFLSANQLDYIRALEANGRKEEAVTIVKEALAEKFTNKVKDNLGILQKVSIDVGNVFSTMWDKISGVGRGVNIDEQIAHVMKQLENVETRSVPDDREYDRLGRRVGNKKQIKDKLKQLQMKQGADLRLEDWNSRSAAAEQDKLEKQALEEKLRPARESLAILQSQLQSKKIILSLDQQIKMLEMDKVLGGQNGQTQIYRDEAAAKLELLKVDQESLDIQKQIGIYAANKAKNIVDGIAKDPSMDLAYQSKITDLEAKRNELAVKRSQISNDLTTKTYANIIKIAEVEDGRLRTQEDSLANYGAQLQAIGAIRREQEIEYEAIGKTVEEIQRLTFGRNLSRMATQAETQATDDLNNGLITEIEYRKRLSDISSAQAQALQAYMRVFNDQQAQIYDGSRGVAEAIREWRIEASKSGELSKNAAKTVISSWEDATLEMLRTGKLNTTKLVDAMINEFLRLKVVKPFVSNVLDAKGASFLELLFGNPAENPSSKDAVNGSDKGWLPYKSGHVGAVAGIESSLNRIVSPLVFNGAPKFHTGGLIGDEVPIIAKRGEGVFTPGQMKAMGILANSSNQSASKVNFNQNVQIINKSEAKVSTQNSETGDLIVTIESALAERVANGQGSMARAIESRYNTKTAGF